KLRDIYNKYLSLTSINFDADENEQTEIVKELRQQNKSKQDLLNELNNLKETDTETVIIKGKSFKRDNKTIAQIKIIRDFKCQICKTTIIKKDGTNYIEAAHIKPKHQKGRESLDNIILLCPNHHKEFDLGNTVIINHTKSNIEFSMNGNTYNLLFYPEGIKYE
ncbi:MAG TPA: HNH endonuclease, partial [Bacteroidia bacterium]|nr:HNH endonuclease [Bacteroidia bacterium]